MPSNIIVEYAHRYRKGVTGKMSKEKWTKWISQTNASLHFKIIREYNAEGDTEITIVVPPEAKEAIENSNNKNNKK